MNRRLVSLRRAVPADGRAEYDALWGALHREATARGAHAWRFVAVDRAGDYLEFLEFAESADPRAAVPVAEALRALATRVAPADADEWLEVTR